MRKFIELGVCLLSLTFLSSCGNGGGPGGANSGNGPSIQSVKLDEISQALGEILKSVDWMYASATSGLSVAQNKSSFATEFLVAAFFKKNVIRNANAIDCSTTLDNSIATCTGGASTSQYRTLPFSNCTFNGMTVNGSLSFIYGQGSPTTANCTLTSNGSSVTLSGERTYQKALDANLYKITSLSNTTFSGETIVGGVKIDVTSYSGATLALTVPGFTRLYQNATGSTISSVSVQATSALTLTGLARTGRKLTAGSLSVYHNTAKYKAVFSVATDSSGNVIPVTWTAGCSCPTGGSLALTTTGGLEGTGTITFQSTCGKVTVSHLKLSNTVQVDSCTAY